MRFKFEGVLLGGVLILIDVEIWFDDAQMYNGYIKDK